VCPYLSKPQNIISILLNSTANLPHSPGGTMSSPYLVQCSPSNLSHILNTLTSDSAWNKCQLCVFLQNTDQKLSRSIPTWPPHTHCLNDCILYLKRLINDISTHVLRCCSAALASPLLSSTCPSPLSTHLPGNHLMSLPFTRKVQIRFFQQQTSELISNYKQLSSLPMPNLSFFDRLISGHHFWFCPRRSTMDTVLLFSQ